MKKHIAYVCADAGIPVFGTKGASIHVQSVVRAALKAGHRVTLFATRFDGHVPPGLENVACVHLPESRRVTRPSARMLPWRHGTTLPSGSTPTPPTTWSTSATRSGATWACAGPANTASRAFWK